MKILFVTPDAPFPPLSGGNIRNANLIGGAATLGDVTVATVEPPPFRDPGGPDQVVLDPLSKGMVFHWPPGGFPDRFTISDRAVTALLKLSAELRPDLVVLEGIGFGFLIPRLRPHVGKIVVDMHNLESELFERTRITSHDPVSRLYRRFKYRGFVAAIRNAERAAAGAADGVWLCSEEDGRKLVAIGARPKILSVVPNGVPPEAAAALAAGLMDVPKRDTGPTLLFVGHLGYKPNVQAVGPLVDAIFPAIRARLPEARLLLAGREPARGVIARGNRPGVEIIAGPPSLAPIFGRADLSVVPLKSGGGTRIKVIESMANGVPVVASAVAVEGLDLVDGETFVRAETPGEFAAAVASLWGDRDRYGRLRRRGFEEASRRFGPAAIAAAVGDATAALGLGRRAGG